VPYFARGKTVYNRDTGRKVGTTRGNVKNYLAALYANAKDIAGRRKARKKK